MSDDPNKEKFFEALSDLSAMFKEHAAKYEKDCNEYWNSLSYDQQLMAFYSVCKRIHQGDVKDGGSYRHVLYDTFEFEPDAYGIGMECGYMDIHNLIFEGKRKNES